MARTKKIKLDLDLIPESCFYSNVRSEVSKKQWDVIRKEVYSRAWHVCEICGTLPQKSLHAHEVWEFDSKNKIQKLVRMIALCPECHEVKHFGLANIRGRSEEALNHFMKINQMSRKDSLNHIDEQFKIWKERSKINWKLDIKYLEQF